MCNTISCAFVSHASLFLQRSVSRIQRERSSMTDRLRIMCSSLLPMRLPFLSHMPSVARDLRIDHTRKAKKLPVRPQSALAGKKEVAKSKSGFDEDDPFSPASSSGSDMSARRRQGGRRRSTCARLRGQRDPRASKDAFFCPLICVVLRKLHASMVLMVSPRPCQDPDVQAVPFHARAQALGATLL